MPLGAWRLNGLAKAAAAAPAVPSAFTDDANTTFLLHFDGSDGSTTITDDNSSSRTARTFTVNGNAQLDTAQYKYGTASLLCDGTGDYINDDDIVWHGASTGTIELYLRLNSTVPFAQGVFSQCSQGTANGFQVLLVQNKFYWYKNGSGALVWNTALSANTWYHLAVVKESSTTVKIYVDGTLRYTNTAQSGLTDSTNDIWFGRGYGVSSGLFDATRYDLNGWIDEVRCSTTARYTANFTPGL